MLDTLRPNSVKKWVENTDPTIRRITTVNYAGHMVKSMGGNVDRVKTAYNRIWDTDPNASEIMVETLPWWEIAFKRYLSGYSPMKLKRELKKLTDIVERM